MLGILYRLGKGWDQCTGLLKKGGGLNCCILAMGENTSSVAFLKRKSVTLCTIIVNGNNFCSELELTQMENSLDLEVGVWLKWSRIREGFTLCVFLSVEQMH